MSVSFDTCYAETYSAYLASNTTYNEDPYCQCYISEFDTYTAQGSSNAMRGIFVLLFLLSISGLCFVSLTIIYDKRLQAHPQPLIAYICIAEALMSYNALLQVLNPVWISCYFGLDQIFAWTTGHFYMAENREQGVKDLWASLNTLCWSNSNFFLFF